MNKKILIIFLIGGLILASSVATAQSVNWETYKNEEYNFSMEYPDGWSKAETSGDMYEIVTFSGPREKGIIVVIEVTEMESPKNLNEEIITKDYGYGGVTVREIATVKSGRRYEMMLIANQESFKEANGTYFKRIIKSFKTE